jgi:DNA-binding CsgD family transcriptional regulator
VAEVRFLATAVPASLAACREAAELAEVAGRPDLLAEAALVVHGVSGVHRTIAGICERALAALPADAHALRARLHAQLAVGVAESEGGRRPAELAAEALAEAEQSGDPVAVIEAIAARHLAISVPHQVTERLELGRRAIALGATSRQPVAALWGHLWRAAAAVQLGNLAVTEQEVAEIERIARERGFALAQWHAHRFRALLAQLSGDFDAARAANSAARSVAQRRGDLDVAALSSAFLLHLALLRGDPTELDPGLEELIEHAQPVPLVRIWRPLTHALQGRRDEALAELDRFRDLPRSYPLGVRWMGTIGQLAIAAELLADAELAADLYPLLAPIAHYYTSDGSGALFNGGAFARHAGEMALLAGRLDDATGHLRDAITLNARIGARPFTALSRLDLARALAVAPSGAGLAEAAELTDRAAAEFRRLDMPGPLARATDLAARIAVRRRSTAALSPREAEVAELVAQALTNRQIAERLVLSERTVETHVHSILTKLDRRTRTEIATWVLTHDVERIG